MLCSPYIDFSLNFSWDSIYQLQSRSTYVLSIQYPKLPVKIKLIELKENFLVKKPFCYEVSRGPTIQLGTFQDDLELSGFKYCQHFDYKQKLHMD